MERTISEIVAGDPVVERAANEYRKVLELRMQTHLYPSRREWKNFFRVAIRHCDEIQHLIAEFCLRSMPENGRTGEETHREDYLVADKLAGAAIFRGLLELAKSVAEEAKLAAGDPAKLAAVKVKYSHLVFEAVRRENLVGLLSVEETARCKQAGIPLVHGVNSEIYRPFAPEKKIIKFFLLTLQNIFAPFRREQERAAKAERETKRRAKAKRKSVSAHDLLTAFRGIHVVEKPLNGQPIYLELEGNGFKIKVVRAEGVAEDLCGESFERGDLPKVIYREIKRGSPVRSDRRNGQREWLRRGRLRFIPGQVKAA